MPASFAPSAPPWQPPSASKLGRPDARVICVTGDGSFMMEQQELATARYHNIPVMVLILHNNAYGGMKRDQIKQLRRPHHRHRTVHPRPSQARRPLRRQRLHGDQERAADASFQRSASERRVGNRRCANGLKAFQKGKTSPQRRRHGGAARTDAHRPELRSGQIIVVPEPIRLATWAWARTTRGSRCSAAT